MIWHLIRYLVSFSIPSFYRRVQSKNVKNIKVKGPVVIAMTHPNSFFDAINFTWVSYPVRLKYLARGDAFKPGIASFILDQIGIVPIFRLRDGGKEGLQKNDESYRQVNKLLQKNAKLIVFAEGLCVQERRLRPLKKGVARMVFGANEVLPQKNLIVIPVGANYTLPSKFRTDLFYNCGEPIKVSDFDALYKENPARAQTQFVQLLDSKLKKLITHINNKANDTVVMQLEQMVMKDWLKRKNLKNSLENEFEVTQHLTELINNLDELEPEKMGILRQKTSDYDTLVRKQGLRDWIINPLNRSKISYPNLFFRYVLMIAGLPIYLVGCVAAYPVYKLTERLTKKILKNNKEFYASVAIGMGGFLFLFNFMAWFFIIYAFSPNILIPLIALVCLLLCARFALLFHFFMLKTFGISRALKNPAVYKNLSEKRAEIMEIMNGLTNF